MRGLRRFFQFSLWDSMELTSSCLEKTSTLSILFMRFRLPLKLSIRSTLITFNSLYEIHEESLAFVVYKVAFNSLYEIHGSTLVWNWGDKWSFQFSLWDSHTRLQLGKKATSTFNSLYEILCPRWPSFRSEAPVFQFSLWDSRKDPRADCYELYIYFQFSLWDSSTNSTPLRISSVAAFNSLYEIR